MTNFQKIISDIVEKDPLRQSGVAEKLGYTDAYISNFVTNIRPLNRNIAKKLEEVYKLDSKQLLAIQKMEESEALKPSGITSYFTPIERKDEVHAVPFEDYMEVEYADLSTVAGKKIENWNI